VELTPTQIYLAIQARLQELGEADELLPFHEAGTHLNSLLDVCRDLLYDNNRLQAQLNSAETLIEEMGIESAIKDMEIFNFTSQSTENTEKDQEN